MGLLSLSSFSCTMWLQVLLVSRVNGYILLNNKKHESDACKRGPRLPTFSQRLDRATYSEDGLQLFQQNSHNCRRCFLLVIETETGYYKRKIKEQSKQWQTPLLQTGKLWRLFFYDCHSIIFVD